LDDHNQLFRDFSNIGHWDLGDYEALINEETDIDYLMSWVK